MTLAKDYIESFSTMFEGLSQAAIYVANDGRLLAVNSSAALLFGMQREELTGQYWAGLDAQLTQIHWLKRWKDIQQQKLVRYETDILTSKQYLRPITVNITLADDEGAMLMLTDKVSEEIKAGELSLVEESMDVGTWSYNRIDGRLRLSEASRRLLGIPPEMDDKEEVIASIGERMGPEELTQLRRLAEDLLTDAGRGKHTLYITNGTGTSRLNVVAHSVGNDLHVTHIYGIVREEGDQNPTFPEGVTAGGFSNSLARFTIDQTNDLIFWTGPGAEVYYVNKTVERTLGYGSDELRDMSVFDFVHDFGQEEIDQLWDVLRREQNVEAEYDLYRKDGSKINILASVNYLKYNGQEYACSFCRDNTLRLQREKRRRLSEFTIDAAGEMILWSKAGGTLTFANKTLLEFTGYTSEEFANLRADDFSPDKKREDFVQYWDRIRQGEVVKYETVIRKKDGTLVPVRASLNYLQFEGEEFNCVYLRDIRRQKVRDRQIELSQVALDSALDCVVWLDNKLRVNYANQRILRLVGQKNWTGEKVQKMLPGIKREHLEGEDNHDFNLVTSNREVRRMNLNCTRLVHDGSEFFSLVMRDVTPLMERQEELENAYSEIRALRDRLQEENTTLKEDQSFKYNIDNIITVSPKYQEVLRQVGQVANVDTTVLIVGETGTGKELLARAVHQLSQREDAALVKVNCAALPAELIESELFGHEKGAFTGAISRKKGRFELAHNGTIFLDEIGEMPLELQPKLLRALQEGEFERVGGTETLKVNARLIAATNRDLEKMVREGTFREDLYYRLNVFPIVNLPLRERPEDIPVLVEYFIRKFARKQGKEITKVSTTDLNKLKQYAFPGNIRELENLIERSVVLCDSRVLSIQLEGMTRKALVDEGRHEFLSFDEMQRNYLIEALKKTNGRITGPDGAGVLLGLNDRTLMSKIRKFRIEKYEYIGRK